MHLDLRMFRYQKEDRYSVRKAFLSLNNIIRERDKSVILGRGLLGYV